MAKKLSQISSGGTLVPSTDQLVAVRSGTSDVLVTGAFMSTNVSTGGTLVNILGTVSFFDYNPSAIGNSGADFKTSFQNFLLDAYQKALALRSQSLDNIVACGVVRAVCPRFSVGLSSPLIIPEYVALDMSGVDFRRIGGKYWLTSGYTSGGATMVINSISGLPATPFYIQIDQEVLQVTAAASTTISVTGAQFGSSAANHSTGSSSNPNVRMVSLSYSGDTTSLALGVLQQPTLIYVPHSHNFGISQPYCNSTGNDRGSGQVCGKNWVPASVTKVSNGNGQYAAGDVLTMAQPSAGSYVAPTITVNSTDGAGGTGPGNIVTFTLTKAGSYALPSVLQASQWTLANGFPNSGAIAAGAKGAVFSSDGSGNFLTSSNNAGGGTGTGATFSVTWTADFVGDGTDYNYGAFIESNMYCGDISVEQSVINPASTTTDPTFGNIFGVLFAGAQFVIDQVTAGGGYYGIWFNCTDCFWKSLNPVDAGWGIKIGPGGGSIRGFVTIDSPSLGYIMQDHADNINIKADFLNIQKFAGTSCLQLGANGSAMVI